MRFFHRHKTFLYAVATLAGAMVGVGIFGMPYAFAKSGFWLGIFLLIALGLATILVDLMYGEVILRTHEHHQLIGYVQRYLGPWFQRLIFFTVIMTGYVALLAYIIISGDFFGTLLSPVLYVPGLAYSLLFGIILSLVVLKGIKTVSWLEFAFSGLFLAIICLLFAAGFHHIDPTNFTGFHRDLTYLPYGVLLFAFGGLIAVPLQRELLVGQEKHFRHAIIYAVLFVAALYALFTTTIVGISGSLTTPDAISGLYPFLGPSITILGALFGAMAITTSFLVLATGMAEMFHFDFHIGKFKSWLLTVLPPLFLFIFGIREFINVISLAGGVSIGLEQIIIVFLYAKAKTRGNRVPEYSLSIHPWVVYPIMTVLTAGIVYFIILR